MQANWGFILPLFCLFLNNFVAEMVKSFEMLLLKKHEAFFINSGTEIKNAISADANASQGGFDAMCSIVCAKENEKARYTKRIFHTHFTIRSPHPASLSLVTWH
jgi:hypothetical protein